MGAAATGHSAHTHIVDKNVPFCKSLSEIPRSGTGVLMGAFSFTIKSYVEISLAVMRRRLEDQYRVWLLARHLDPKGSSRVQIKRLREFVLRHRICTHKTLQRALRDPSIFWIKYGGWVQLIGVLKVADVLGVELRSQPVMLPLSAFSSMFHLRAVFVASYLSGKPRTIAIDTLSKLTGRSRSAIIRYLKSPHVVKIPNAMSSVRRPSRHLDPDLARQGYFHTRVNGRWRLVKRMPNTYETDLETAPRGMTVKQRRRSSLSTEEAPSPGEATHGSPEEGASCDPRGIARRRYYQKQRAAHRALQSLSPDETVYTLCPGRHDDLGFQLWRGWTILERGGPVKSW